MLNKNIGKLRVVLGLEDREFRQGLQRSAPRLRAFGRAMAVTVAGAAAAGAAGMALLTRRSLEQLDAQSKLAESFDTSVESVQILQRAAQLAVASMSEATSGARSLTRRLSMFATDGGGPAADAIERLHLDVTDLMALPLDDRLRVINNALATYATEAERASLMSQLFGDDSLTAFSRLSNASLDQANAELERFGVLVSDVEAERIEEANDAISRIGLVMEGMGNRMAAQLAPILTMVADGLTEIADRRSVLERAIDNNTLAIGDEIGQINQLLALRPGQNQMTLEAARVTLAEAEARWENVRGMRAELRQQVINSEEFQRLSERIERAQGVVETFRGAMPTGPLVDSTGQFDPFGQNLQIVERAEQQLAELLRRREEMLNVARREATDRVLEDGEGVQELTRMIELYELAIENAEGGFVILNGELVTANDLSERLTSSTSATSDAADRLASALQSGSVFSSQMLANLMAAPGAAARVAAGVSQQIAAMEDQNRVLELQIEGGVPAAVAERQRQLEQMLAAAGSGGRINFDEVVALQQQIDALNASYERQQELRDRLAASYGGGETGGGGGGGGLSDAERAAADIYRRTRTELERLNEEQAQLNRLHRAGALDTDTYQRAMAQLNEQMLQAEYPHLINAVDSTSEALARAIVMGEDFGDQMARIFQQLAVDIISSGVREAIMDVLSPMSGGGGGGFLSNLLGSVFGGIGGGGAPVKSFDGGGFTGWDARTGGLDGKGGFLAMMHPQEVVTDLTRGAASGRSMNVQFVVNNNAPGVEVEQRRERGPDGREVFIAEVNRSAGVGDMDQGLGGRLGLTTQTVVR